MTAGPSGRPQARSIGAVVELLRAEFPDVSVSKIRFLEAEGLVQPQRLQSGLRRFSDDDVERLRFVLRAQRDRFWPLRVIRSALDRIDQGLPVEDGPAQQPPAAGEAAPRESGTIEPRSVADAGARLPTASELARRRPVRISPAELREQADLDQPLYAALKAYGLIRTDAAGRHGADDLDVARRCVALARYGLEPRHLRLFRVAADRQVGLVDQILEPVRRRRARGDTDADPDRVQAELLAHALALQAALVRAGLESGS